MSQALYNKGRDETKRQGFQLPPEITQSKVITQEGNVAYVFDHDLLGELGRLVIVGINGQTRVDTVLSTKGSNLEQKRRADIFLPLAKKLNAIFNNALGLKKPPEKIIPHPGLNSGVIQSQVFPCNTCGSPSMTMVHAIDANTTNALKQYYLVMKDKIMQMGVPTWIVGQEHEVQIDGESAGNALCMKVYPNIEKAKHIDSNAFNAIIDQHMDGHCSANSKVSNKDKGNAYLLWRNFLETYIARLCNDEYALPDERLACAAKQLGIFAENEPQVSTDSENDVLQMFALFHYHKENEPNWLDHCLGTNTTITQQNDELYAQMTEALKHSHFTCLKLIDVLSLNDGVMLAHDLITNKEITFIDRALCQNLDRGYSFYVVASVISTGEFVMTVGGSVPLGEDNRTIVDNFNKRIAQLDLHNRPTKENEYILVYETLREIYRSGLLKKIDVNYL